MPETFVIVGASLAGATAAVTLREEGFEGRIVLIGDEPQLPYERPPLSKAYLRGEEPFEKSFVRPANLYRERDIEMLVGVRVERVDPASRTVHLAGDEQVSFDKVLIATGSRNRRFPIPGLDLEGVYDLRTVADADLIRSEISPGKKAVVVGMGFIGAEVAASLRQSGVEVTSIEMAKTPLGRVLGEEIGRVIEGFHRDNGVEMIFEDSVEAFEGNGRVARIQTKNGRAIECDFAVVGVGVEPVTDLIEGTLVEVDNGILVDEFCRTNVEGVYAAGDVANHFHPLFEKRIRVEHFQNAHKQGAAAAKSMLGRGEPYAEVHWFWSDQYDYNLQYAGFHTDSDEMAVRGSLSDRNFAAFYLQNGRIIAAVGIDRAKDVRAAMRLIAARTRVSAEHLENEDVELKKLLG